MMDYALFSQIVGRRFGDRIVRSAREPEAIENLGKVATEVAGHYVELRPGQTLTTAEVEAVQAEVANDLAADEDRARWAAVREERDRRLQASDWTQMGLADTPLTAERREAWAAYRRALRNVPSDFADPTDVVWPVTP